MLEQLEHNGVVIPNPPPYRGLVMYVRDESVQLTPRQEEMALAWANKQGTDYVDDPVFVNNFMEDLSEALGLDGTLRADEVDFRPVIRVAEKSVVEDGPRTRIRRRYDQARTPFDRLCDTGVLSPDVQAQLTSLRKQTNPRQLLAQIEAQLDYIFPLPCRTPDHTEVVYDTLSEIPDPRPETEPVR